MVTSTETTPTTDSPYSRSASTLPSGTCSLVCRSLLSAGTLVLMQVSSDPSWTWSSFTEDQYRGSPHAPEHLEHLQGSSIRFISFSHGDDPDAFGPVACLDMYGLRRTYLNVHQALSSLLLPPPIHGQPEMAAHRLVDQLGLCYLVVYRGNRILHVSVLACPMVLDTVLSTIPCWAVTDLEEGPVQCYHRPTCCHAFDIQPYLGRRAIVITHRSHLKASRIFETKARSCYRILGRSTVGSPHHSEILPRATRIQG